MTLQLETQANRPTDSGARPVLEVQDLQVHFFTRRGVVRAVNGVSFNVMPGETLGLVGESGSGKTITCLSLLRLLPRGARIVGGKILFNGRNTLDMYEREMETLRGINLGMILQNSMAALDPVFTIGTQIAEPLVVHSKLNWKTAMERSVDLLRMVKITAPHLRVRNYPHEMSGGMRQRASSAASIGPRPDLLIADEPTTALDVTTQRQYLELLKEIQRQTGMGPDFHHPRHQHCRQPVRQPGCLLRRLGGGVRPQRPSAESPHSPLHRGAAGRAACPGGKA